MSETPVRLAANLSDARIRSLDPGDMLGKTLELPEQIRVGLRLGREFVESHELARPDYIEWIGLGGSAVAGDVLRGLGCAPPAMPLTMDVRRYPQQSSAVRLVCSYSGNTVESVRALEEVPPWQVWFAMSSGGRLQQLAVRTGVPHLRLPGGYPPRAAVGFSLGAMFSVFERLYDFPLNELDHALNLLTEDRNSYREHDPLRNEALALAARLIDRTPVIYVTDGVGMSGLAIRYRAQLAENAKTWSHSAEFPELAHNEVEALSFLAQVLPPPQVQFLGSWTLSDRFGDPRPGMEKLLDERRLPHERLDPATRWPNEGRLTQGLRMMLLLDAATVYLALLRAKNPSEIPLITQLKQATPVS